MNSTNTTNNDGSISVTFTLKPIGNVRDISGHEINGMNRELQISADQPGAGNASHEYTVLKQDTIGTAELGILGVIQFQDGPIKENGINGISNEVLLAIVADRLRGFQSGPYACRTNALALTKIEEALHWLHARTHERESRGVEGTNKL